ncbi:MAG: hypothetical protein QM804_16805 [Propionicimonas sp.]
MHQRQEITPELRGLIGAQRGIIRADQALAHGLGRSASTRLVAQGYWKRITPGLFDASPLTDDFEKDAWAALLGAGDRAAIGGEAALRLHGLNRRADDGIEVWVPPGSQPNSFAGVIVRRDRAGRIPRARGLLTRISIEDAVVDVGQFLSDEALVGLISDATRLRITTLRRIAEAVSHRTRLRGRRQFGVLLADLGGIESTLEFAYRRDVERAHGLPAGQRNVSVSRGTRSDVFYSAYGVLVELDGRLGHEDAESAFRDLNRDNLHALVHKTTLRYGSHAVRGRPCEVAAQVGYLLIENGWPGPVQPCSRCRLVAAY